MAASTSTSAMSASAEFGADSKHDTLYQARPLPPRCFWALWSCTPEPRFVYVDPGVQAMLGSSTSLSGFAVSDFVHPEDRERVRGDLDKMVQTRSLLGSVTRCRFATLSTLSRMCITSDGDEYMSTDMVVNWVGTSLALCFFHGLFDDWRPCGSSAPFDAAQAQLLTQQLQKLEICSAALPEFVFQVLDARAPHAVLFNWPPSRGTYDVQAMAGLVQGAASTCVKATKCTQRFRASHLLTLAGSSPHTVASVVIPCSGMLLACFQVSSAPTDMNSTALTNSATSSLTSQPTAATSSSMSTVALPNDVQPAMPDGLAPDSFNTTNVAALAAVAAASVAQNKSCTSCGRADSPEWRRGPSGHKTVRHSCVETDQVM